jgi:dienelactone hydrolase
MHTLEQRWRKLWPSVVQYGPADDLPRPAVVMFHGCGGVREHMAWYARAAAEMGWRAFVVDSYSARGWSRKFGATFTCIGLAFRGYARSGDVLAAAWGVQQLRAVDPDNVVLAGWSHGAWAVMDLMTLPLTQRGEARLVNPSPDILSKVDRLFLAYPYLNVVARSRSHAWVRAPRVFAIVPQHDHLASIRTHLRAYAAALSAGASVELWPVDGTHAFDEPDLKAPEHLMRHDPVLAAASIEKFKAFLSAGPQNHSAAGALSAHDGHHDPHGPV